MGARHLEGYRQGLAAAGLESDESLVMRHQWWDEMGYEAGHRFGLDLLALADPPTAIVCCADSGS